MTKMSNLIILLRVTVLFPESYRWYSLYTYIEIKGIINPMNVVISDSEIGSFIKGGSIVPMRSRIKRSSKLTKEEPYLLVIALDSEYKAIGNIYIDDEETYNFEKGKFCLKRFIFQKNQLSIINVHDNYKHNNQIEGIIITGLQALSPKEINLVKPSKKYKKLEFDFNYVERILTIHRFRISLDEEQISNVILIFD